jgi:hypothetical protein
MGYSQATNTQSKIQMNDPILILPAEHFGTAKTEDGFLDIGGVKIPYRESINDTAQIYVRRFSSDLSIVEICIANHDGLAQEVLDQENEEAKHHPLGAKEYWRVKMVGHYTYGADSHLMTNEDFEEDWADE